MQSRAPGRSAQLTGAERQDRGPRPGRERLSCPVAAGRWVSSLRVRERRVPVPGIGEAARRWPRPGAWTVASAGPAASGDLTRALPVRRACEQRPIFNVVVPRLPREGKGSDTGPAERRPRTFARTPRRRSVAPSSHADPQARVTTSSLREKTTR